MRFLLQTDCRRETGGREYTTHYYYDTDLRVANNPAGPVEAVYSYEMSCTFFIPPANQFIESYCTLNANNEGILRTITTDGNGYFTTTDVRSSQCDGTCDLMIQETFVEPTTTNVSNDGIITLWVTSSNPPIDCYIPTLGLPTSTSTNAPLDPNYYTFVYNNVPPGTYAAQLQDNNNCMRNSVPLTILAGGAPGTGSPGLPSGYDWFKFELVHGRSGPSFIRGYAWNKTTKQAYVVASIPLNFPAFYQYTTRYAQGSIVSYVRRNESDMYYYRAKVELLGSDFVSNNRKIPYPDAAGVSGGYWEQITFGNPGFIQFRLNSTNDPLPPNYVNISGSALFQSPDPWSYGYWFYDQNTIVRVGWTSFYKAKTRLESRSFSDGRIPVPTPGGDRYWEVVEGYGFDTFYYVLPEGTAIDQYSVGPLTRRVLFHVFDITNPGWAPPQGTTSFQNADGDYVIFEDSNPAIENQLGDLKVVDIIKNDIDDAGVENGSAWVQAISPSPPIRYHLRNGVRPGYVQDNLTGKYENLHAGSYLVDIYDALERYVTAEFTISDPYRPRWRLLFDDMFNKASATPAQYTPLEVYVYERDWTGGVTDVMGGAEPVILSWDSGASSQDYLPEAIGANLDFNVLTSIARQFKDTALYDDRKHRIDFKRNGKLQFRGYINSSLYSERMLGAGQKVTITATDGLGQLNNTLFINHLRERQEGRTSMLSIVLKCLSFCDVNLPVYCSINLRDRLMNADGDPLNEAFVHRNAYNKKNGKVIADEDIIDCRTVVNSILRLFNAFLVQADGAWRIIALNEVHDEAACRVWSPAGVLMSNVDTTVPPLRILEPQYATGERELFWINSTQNEETCAAMSIVKAVVNLQLETNLFRNGDFVQWDGNRPLYWSKTGTLSMLKAKGEKAKELALKFTGYGTAFDPTNYLLSPIAPHLPGQDEDAMIIKFKAIVEAVTNDPEVTVDMYFQVLTDGSPYGQPFVVSLTSKDKWKEYELPILTGMPGTTIRVRMLTPVATSGQSTVRVNSVSIEIRPGGGDWSDVKADFVEVENDAMTGIRLPDIEIAHADLPLLPNLLGNPLPAKKMDVYAWRHAISLADFRATTGWKRPDYPDYRPLLENVVQDRAAQRTNPSTVVTGQLTGPGINYLRSGMMLDMPEDQDGLFLVVDCFKNERNGTAEVTLRKLADGLYGDVLPDIPDDVRVANKRTRAGYRISFVDGEEGYRGASIV